MVKLMWQNLDMWLTGTVTDAEAAFELAHHVKGHPAEGGPLPATIRRLT